MNTGPPPGFYGKVPALGDFVSRRLSRGFTEPWDAWLQSCLACSREQLGDDWLEIYLTSPMWRFVLSPSLCGEQAWAGAVMPSVDRVGRYFPLAIAMASDGQRETVQIIAAGDEWFRRAEAELLSALDDDGFEIEAFDRRVAALSDDFPPTQPGKAIVTPAGLGTPWRVGLDDSASAGARLPDLLAAMLSAGYGPYSIWWTSGSAHVRPSLLVCTGMPQASRYASLLVGDWQTHGWHDASPASGESRAPGMEGDAA